MVSLESIVEQGIRTPQWQPEVVSGAALGRAVILVGGNPETEVIWKPSVEAARRDDVVLLSPPGFGAPLPDGFPATYLAYCDWLEGELKGFDEPVDLANPRWLRPAARWKTPLFDQDCQLWPPRTQCR